MKEMRLIMDMPVTVIIPDTLHTDIFDKIFNYFHYVDNTFSTFKDTSEISKINNGLLKLSESGNDMKEIFRLSDQTKLDTDGFFDIRHENRIDPSGIVKGWAIHNGANLIRKSGIADYYVEIGGDIEVAGSNPEGNVWTIGVRNPFNTKQIIKKVYLHNNGIATSGTYERGKHIYNPKTNQPVDEIVSLTVIGPDVYEADRFATPAFAMGKAGIRFIENLKGFEGYMIDSDGIATMTSGFGGYTSI